MFPPAQPEEKKKVMNMKMENFNYLELLFSFFSSLHIENICLHEMPGFKLNFSKKWLAVFQKILKMLYVLKLKNNKGVVLFHLSVLIFSHFCLSLKTHTHKIIAN